MAEPFRAAKAAPVVPPARAKPRLALKAEPMTQSLAHVALVVRDYDEAIAFYTEKLGFTLVEDKSIENKRWVLIAPLGRTSPSLLLARAVTPEQESRIGNQTGGRVFLFLHTDDFWHDYRNLTARGVRFVRPPKEECYGTVAVFEDLYGNLWDLLQLHQQAEPIPIKSAE